MKNDRILLFNPRAANHKARIPNSVLQVAASIEGHYDWVIVDGNLETDPEARIMDYLADGSFRFFGSTVMPGPQLKQAIPITRKVKVAFPDITTVWGGYFPSNHPEPVLRSGYVDFVINGVGDKAFPQLIEAVLNGGNFRLIRNLIFLEDDQLVTTVKDTLLKYDELPPLPYGKLSAFYPIEKYLGRSYLGNKTIAYHSSFGCPFQCSFCAVVPIYQARWNGKSAELIYRDIRYLREHYGGDAIEFHDNNFFVSEKRTVAFAQLILPDRMTWWGEARIDTLDKYKDSSLALMREAGCKMIFFGAESGNDDLLQMMDKGGKQNSRQILNFARRLKQFDIIPEYSFVLGWPAANEATALAQVEREIEFIKKVKSVNPDTEIIIYVYSPVPTEGSAMFEKVKQQGFSFPQRLEDWISPAWENFDLRKNPLTPWLTRRVIDRIKDFETVLNAYYPTVSDIKLSALQTPHHSGSIGLAVPPGLAPPPLRDQSIAKVLAEISPAGNRRFLKTSGRLKTIINTQIRKAMDRFYRPVLVRYLARERSYRLGALRLTIPPSVFHPAFFGSSKVFLRFLRQQDFTGRKVLEIGCGSGILSLHAASRKAEVTAIDVNPEAVRATRENAAKNELNLRVLQSDMFQSLPPQQFDVIIINPPFFEGDPTDPAENAWYCGTGFSFFSRFFHEYDQFLQENGKAWMILSETCDLDAIHQKAREHQVRMKPVYEATRIFEKFLIYQLS